MYRFHPGRTVTCLGEYNVACNQLTRRRSGIMIGAMQPAVGPDRDPQGRDRMAVCILLTLTFLVFSPTLGAPFHLDDVMFLADPVVTSPSGWWYVWRPLQTRPLTYLTFWINYQLGGDNAAGYHAVNIALHLLAVWLLFRVLARIGPRKPALIAAAIFALHPIQTEPVAYIFERATLLATIFCLLSASAWFAGDYARSAGLFIFALLSKEECVAFPLVLLATGRALAPTVWMLGLSLIAGVRVLIALEVLGISGAGRRAGIAAFDYLATQGIVILRYFRLLLVPYGFTCDPGIPVLNDWRAWLAWAVILFTAALVWRVHPQGKWFAAGLVLLAPSSSIFPAEDLAADRRVYLPMVCFAYFAALLLVCVRSRLILVSGAIALALLSTTRANVWRSEQRLWREAVDGAPKKVRPRVLLARASNTETALKLLDEAQAFAPGDVRPLVEKAVRLMAVNLPEMALQELERALRLAPNDTTVLNNYGVALSKLGKNDAAIEQFRRVLRAEPCSNAARTNLLRLGVTVMPPCNSSTGLFGPSPPK
jgi:protein O-mannosyl-transferase